MNNAGIMPALTTEKVLNNVFNGYLTIKFVVTRLYAGKLSAKLLKSHASPTADAKRFDGITSYVMTRLLYHKTLNFTIKFSDKIRH